MPRRAALLAIFALLAVAGLVRADDKIDEEFQRVTCNSAVKLTHASGFKLHSHSVNYGSGSGQQSVTGFPENNDPNSLWAVVGGIKAPCKRGEPWVLDVNNGIFGPDGKFLLVSSA